MQSESVFLIAEKIIVIPIPVMTRINGTEIKDRTTNGYGLFVCDILTLQSA